MSRAPAIACLTDFGTRDWYAGTLKGVLLSRAPGIPILDLSHDIPPYDVRAGALALAAAAPWFPRRTVFLAVVDPGVGSDRALLAAEADGRYFVGPDNGLLMLALTQARRRRIVHLARPRYWLPGVSRTFHGRDILAPVAAHLARGGSLLALGPPVRPRVPLPWPAPQRTGRRWAGRIVHIDAFGNLITNLPGSAASGSVVRCRGRRVPVVSSYAAGRAGRLAAVVNSLGLVELAVPGASAATRLRAQREDAVALGPG